MSEPLPSFPGGQSFVVPAGVTWLDAFQFWMRNDPATRAPGQDFSRLTYRLVVTAFDSVGRQVGGAPVYTSASRAAFADFTATGAFAGARRRRSG